MFNWNQSRYCSSLNDSSMLTSLVVMVGTEELLTCEKQTMSQSTSTTVIRQKHKLRTFIILLLLVFVFCFVFKNCNHARTKPKLPQRIGAKSIMSERNSARFEFIGVRECFRVINVHIKWIVCGLGQETIFMECV